MKYIAFDMDGTLYDCSGAIEGAYERASKILSEITGIHVPPPTLDKIRSVLGNTADKFFSILFPSIDVKEMRRVEEICTQELVADVRRGKGLLYEGVPELFADIAEKGWKILIASNGQRAYLNAILETYRLDTFLAVGPVTVEDACIKTKSDILRHYIESFAIKERLVMVGDRRSDLVAARDNGAYFIGCVFGHAGGEEIEGADYVVHSVGEIVEVIERQRK